MVSRVPFEVIYDQDGQIFDILPILFGEIVPTRNGGYAQIITGKPLAIFSEKEIRFVEMDIDILVAKQFLGEI